MIIQPIARDTVTFSVREMVNDPFDTSVTTPSTATPETVPCGVVRTTLSEVRVTSLTVTVDALLLAVPLTVATPLREKLATPLTFRAVPDALAATTPMPVAPLLSPKTPIPAPPSDSPMTP
jgi:hypothetical protein